MGGAEVSRSLVNSRKKFVAILTIGLSPITCAQELKREPRPRWAVARSRRDLQSRTQRGSRQRCLCTNVTETGTIAFGTVERTRHVEFPLERDGGRDRRRFRAVVGENLCGVSLRANEHVMDSQRTSSTSCSPAKKLCAVSTCDSRRVRESNVRPATRRIPHSPYLRRRFSHRRRRNFTKGIELGNRSDVDRSIRFDMQIVDDSLDWDSPHELEVVVHDDLELGDGGEDRAGRVDRLAWSSC